VVAPIADVHGDPPVDGLEHLVARVALQKAGLNWSAVQTLYAKGEMHTYYFKVDRLNIKKSGKTFKFRNV
jgi:hypothetical protein